MELPAQNDAASSGATTHSVKRRKCYRKRGEAEDVEPVDNNKSESNEDAAEPLSLDDLIAHHGYMKAQENEDTQLSAAQILRLRKAAQRRRGGIEFTNYAINARDNSAEPEDIDVSKDKEDDTLHHIKTVVERFAPQTGQVADVDKHMMAFIDSELAKRRQGHESTTSNEGGGKGNLFANGSLIDAGLHRQPATLGKLHEIDLGPDATLRNIARTEAAKRRLEGGEMEAEDGESGKLRKRDGKPWRARRRRNSEDIKRDKIVEEVMRESRLEIYDEPEPEPPNDDQAADDRIAEQFRRDFLDAISSRRQRSSQAAKAAKAKANGTKLDDRPKGPKLGGSRSARAAMRELQVKAKK